MIVLPLKRKRPVSGCGKEESLVSGFSFTIRDVDTGSLSSTGCGKA